MPDEGTTSTDRREMCAHRTVPPGETDNADAAWRLKERIRRHDGALDQRRSSFLALYRRGRGYLTFADDEADRDDSPGSAAPAVEPGDRDLSGFGDRDLSGFGDRDLSGFGDRDLSGFGDRDLLGFAVVRRDGYLSLFGVTPDRRRTGIGSQLLDRVLADHDDVTCHVKVTNGAALAFYADRGFRVVDRRERYYHDGTDAYRLAHDPERADRPGASG